MIQNNLLNNKKNLQRHLERGKSHLYRRMTTTLGMSDRMRELGTILGLPM